MRLDDAVAYYAELIHSSAPFREALAWTVIRPIGEPLSVEDIACRLTGGGHPEVVESDEEFTEEAEFLEGKAVYVGQAGGSTMLIEPGGFSYAGMEKVMAWLSQDAQVWHQSWNLTGIKALEYAAHGQWLARIPALEPEWLHGVEPAALEKEAAALREVAEAPWPARQATAMAIIEARTGARLPMDWFDHSRPVVIVDPLIAMDCPPLGLWHYDPDLDSRLRMAPREIRRAVLLRLADVLTVRFNLSMPAISQAVRAAHDDCPLDVSLLEKVRGEWEILGSRWAGQGVAVREKDEAAWRRWVAANAVRQALRSLGQDAANLDGVTYARFALEEDWADVRRWIRVMVSDPDALVREQVT